MILFWGGRGVVSVPVEGELGEMGGRDGKGFGWSERFEQGFEGSGEFGLMLVDGIEEMLGCFVALLFEQVSQVFGFLGSGLGKLALHIEVANLSGGSAEDAQELAGLL